jgi:hypothetical protein
METLNSYFQPVLEFVQEGYGQLASNSGRAIFIAFVATLFLASWKQLAPMAIAAAVVHKLIDFLAPILMGNTAPRLPALAEVDFWVGLAQLCVGYALLIAVFFFLKKTVFKNLGGSAAKAH